ncbi:MAG: hypothetical protein IJ092_03140 [Atopobiaceae bacterium]|nr:hypothetical protein [Atopobiaceae bacterium]
MAEMTIREDLVEVGEAERRDPGSPSASDVRDELRSFVIRTARKGGAATPAELDAMARVAELVC